MEKPESEKPRESADAPSHQAQQVDVVDDALDEALRQVESLVAEEDDRRKSADTKLGGAQNVIGFVVTISGGALSIGFAKDGSHDAWHVLIVLAVCAAVICFLWASKNVVDGLDPVGYQRVLAASIAESYRSNAQSQKLKEDLLSSLVSNQKVNLVLTDTKLTFYRAAIEKIFIGLCVISIVPLLVLLASSVAAFGPTVRSTLTPPAHRRVVHGQSHVRTSTTMPTKRP